MTILVLYLLVALGAIVWLWKSDDYFGGHPPLLLTILAGLLWPATLVIWLLTREKRP